MKSLTYLLVALIPLLPSCSLFANELQSVTISATEPAAISVDGQYVGESPVVVQLKRHPHVIEAVTDDGRRGVHSLGTRVSDVGVLDVIGGILFLVPFLGVVGPGFRTLEADTVNVGIPEGEE